MENLTAVELKTLNNVSQVLNPNVVLGTILQNIITVLPTTGTPVNAVNATKTLSIDGVVIHGETVTINNPAVAGSDVYEFLADTAQTKTAPGNIAVDITASTTKSSGTLTIDTQPTAGDKMTIGTKEYTFVPVGTDTADGEISIGANLAGAQAAIVAAINGTDDVNEPNSLVSASAFTENVCTITALIGGIAGDAIVTTETFTAVSNVFGNTTLGGGVDCTAANAITALVAAINASDTQGVGAADGTGDVVILTADVAGAAGNSIVIGETLANGAFADDATKLSGGINATVGAANEVKRDNTYLYLCIAENTVADKNWRRIALGSAF
jgi:hypothetical protein